MFQDRNHAARASSPRVTSAPPLQSGVVLRSALFHLLMWLSVLPFTLVAILVVPFRFSHRFHVIKQWARLQLFLLHHICNLDYNIVQYGALPDRPSVVLAKHQSAWETLVFQLIFPPSVWVLKRSLLWIPFFGWALASLRPIAIDRRNRREAMQQILVQGRERLDSGAWVIVFPEGTRVQPGKRRRYGLGGAVLATGTGHTMVPVAHNAGLHWARRGFIKHPGTIRVEIGAAITPDGRSAEQCMQLAEQWIESTTRRLCRLGSDEVIRVTNIPAPAPTEPVLSANQATT